MRLKSFVSTLAFTVLLNGVESVNIKNSEEQLILAAQTNAETGAEAGAGAQAEMLMEILKILALLKRPSVICNGGNPGDHKTKINFIDTHEDNYVTHVHDGSGGSSTIVSDGKKGTHPLMLA